MKDKLWTEWESLACTDNKAMMENKVILRGLTLFKGNLENWIKKGELLEAEKKAETERIEYENKFYNK